MRKRLNSELKRLDLDQFKAADKTPIVLVLDNVRSAYNVGSVFRTADAFLLEGMYLCGITARPPHREIRKTALGASDSVFWQYSEDTTATIKQLQAEGYTIVAIEQAENSVALQDFNINKDQKYALIFGHEVKGIANEVMGLVDSCIEIPQFGTKHSLNIAVSVGIVVWDLFSKMK